MAIVSENSIGTMAMHKAIQMIMQTAAYILYLKLFPHIYAIMSKGFHENFMRPIGGGRYGSMLGSSRPSPFGHAFADDIGRSSKLT